MAPANPLPNVRVGFQEVLFAQRLADNEKKTREKALKKLRTFLTVKSSSGPGFSDDDGLKVWKGLFYCMYMADKPLVQEDVAEEISHLIHYLGNLQDRCTFTTAAFRTFAREWNGIDVFRIDKFMMFVRRVLRQMFEHLKDQKWNLKEVAKYVSVLETTIIRPDDNTNIIPLGLKLHLCSIILEELAKIGEEHLKHEVILAVIQPYLKVLALSKIKEYRNAVSDEIVRHLIRQSDIGIEYEEGRGSEGNDLVEEEDSGENAQENAVQNEDLEDSCLRPEELVLDPRAGEVNAVIPQIFPDFDRLADALQSLGGLKSVSKVNRNEIYHLVKELKDVAQGCYPLGLPEAINTSDIEDPEEEEEEAVKRLEKFYEDLKKGVVMKNDKMGDLTKDALSNYSITGKQLGKRRKGKKLKSREKKLKLKEKKKLAKQFEAADVNRKKAVEGKISAIAKMYTAPDTTDTTKSTKRKDLANESVEEGKKLKVETKVNKKMKKKHHLKDKIQGFEVSSITSDAKKDKIEVVPEVVSFEVSAASVGKKQKKEAEKDKSEVAPEVTSFEVSAATVGKKRKNQAESESSKKKIKESYVVTELSSPSTPTTKAQPKKDVTKKVKEIKPDENVNAFFEVPEFVSSKVKTPKKGVSTETVQNETKEECQEISKEKVATENEKVQVTGGGLNKKLKSTPKKKVTKPGKTGASPNQNKPVSNSGGQIGSIKDKGLLMNFGSGSKVKPLLGKSLQEEDIDMFLKNRRLMKLEKRKSANFSSPKATSKTPKKRTIKINLQQNQEHDIKDYEHSIKNSPQIPYSADRLPKAPVLKPSPSPILIKKPALHILKNYIRKASPSKNVASSSLKKKKSPGSKIASPGVKKKSPMAKKNKRSLASDFF